MYRRSGVPQEPDHQGVQVLRRHGEPRPRARRHGRGRPQRVGQVQRGRRDRAGCSAPRRRRRCGPRRWTTSSSPARPSAARSGGPRSALTIDNTAGLLPIDFSEVTLTRTLFRTGESEYSINGVPCRLLDLQELLSDSGVGRMQHVIISQGQIDAVLNAKPTERRLIIEEAAGVLKYRQAQGEGRAPARRPPRPTSPGSRTCSARSAVACARSSARPRPPAATATSSPSSTRSVATSPAASWPGSGTASRPRPASAPATPAPRRPCGPACATSTPRCCGPRPS